MGVSRIAGISLPHITLGVLLTWIGLKVKSPVTYPVASGAVERIIFGASGYVLTPESVIM